MNEGAERIWEPKLRSEGGQKVLKIVVSLGQRLPCSWIRGAGQGEKGFLGEKRGSSLGQDVPSFLSELEDPV